MNSSYLPNNLTQLIGFFIMIGSATFMGIKFIEWYFELVRKKHEDNNQARIKLALAEKERDIKLAEANVELAKHNTLSANNVAEILKSYNEVIDELEEMKKKEEYKNERMLEAINRLEKMIHEQMTAFSNFVTVNFKK